MGDVDVFRVAEVTDKAPVHDLGHALIGGADPAVGGDVKDDGVGGDALSDLLQQHLQLCAVAASGTEEFGGAGAKNVAVGQGEAQDLGEARFAGAEEPGDPDTDAFVRVSGSLIEFGEDAQVVLENGVGDDVFLDLGSDDGGVILVDLDDLLDGAIHLTSEQFLDAWHGGLENSGAVVGVRVERTHEAETGGAVEFTRVEQNGGDVQAPFHLLQEGM